jgi:hypothetical protein
MMGIRTMNAKGTQHHLALNAVGTYLFPKRYILFTLNGAAKLQFRKVGQHLCTDNVHTAA